MTQATTERKNPYDLVTQRIIEKLETGTVPWQKPWQCDHGWLQNMWTAHPYQGINIFLLASQGYPSPYWATFEQIKAHKGYVRKGEKGTPIIKLGAYIKDKSTEEERGYKFLKYYTVFNVAAQTEGIEVEEPEKPTSTFTPIEACEKLVGNMPQKPAILHGDTRAYYVPSRDVVCMPDPQMFRSREEYYSTLFHELTHSTGHEDRLKRATLMDLCKFGDTNYSKEELVAEMGATFLCAATGIENSTIDNSAAYLQGWLRALRNDKTLLISAASQAQRAADFIRDRSLVSED